jgi:hypothetical protein
MCFPSDNKISHILICIHLHSALSCLYYRIVRTLYCFKCHLLYNYLVMYLKHKIDYPLK